MKKILFIFILQVSLSSFAQITFEKTYFTDRPGYAASAYADSSGYTLGGKLDGQSHYEPVLIKTNLYGDIIWTKILYGINGNSVNDMAKTNDGGFVFMNSHSNIYTKSDIHLIKTNAFGNVLWNDSIVKQNCDEGQCIIQTSDNGYIIAGKTNSIQGINYPYPYNSYIVKTNSYGDSLYTRDYGRVNINDYSLYVIETYDSNYVFVGYGDDYGINEDQVYLIKLNQNGDTLWTRNIGDTHSEQGYCIKETLDKNYIITGSKCSSSNSDVYLIKTDTNGNVLWEKTYDFNSSDAGERIFVLDNGYIIAGKTNNGLLLLRINGVGDTLWSRITQLDTHIYNIKSIDKCNDGGYIITGHLGQRLVLLKTDSVGCIKPLIYSISGEQNVSLNDTTSYYSSSIRGNSYYWFSSFGNITSGVNSDNVDLYWNQIGIDTLYSVVFNDCGSDTLTYIINIDSCVAPKISPIYGNFTPDLAHGTEYQYRVEKKEGKTPVNYTWSVNIGNVINGQGTDTVTIEWFTTGIDELMVIAENECGRDTSSNSVIIIINDIIENTDSNYSNISVFPIPTNDNINIDLPLELKRGNVQIIDIYGKQKYISTLHSGLNKINLSTEPKGLYFLKISIENNTIIRKILLTE